jgi:hypothetical protein
MLARTWGIPQEGFDKHFARITPESAKVICGMF